jgi:hypothetical protein
MLSDIARAELASYAVQLRNVREAVELGYSKLQ